jgi:hypothetical protein
VVARPDRSEVMQIVSRLRKESRKAARDFRYFTPNTWDQHIGLLKSWCARLVDGYKGDSFTPTLRLMATRFLASYGRPTGGMGGVEPMTMRLNLRHTPTHADLFAEAAAKRKMSVTDFIREAALKAAREELGE